MQAGLGGGIHQRVVAGVELDLVHPAPQPVVAVEYRRVGIGQARMGLHGAAAH
jgi:hypothetical protein